HHTRHVAQKAPGAVTPPSVRLATPTDALTVVDSPAASAASATTPATRSRDGRKPGTPPRSDAPITASRVLPKAIPQAEANGTALSPFTSSAPRATPGQSQARRRPYRCHIPPQRPGRETSLGQPVVNPCQQPNLDRVSDLGGTHRA